MAGTWLLYAKAKKYLGTGVMKLDASAFKMQLHGAAASATIKVLSTRSTNASVLGEICATGGYVAGGKSFVPKWTVGVSAKQYKFTMSTVGLTFTASGASLKSIKYALIRNSTSAAGGKVLCFCTLSTGAFSIVSPNTLTILPAATGLFVLS